MTILAAGRWTWDTARAAIGARDHVTGIADIGRHAARAASRITTGIGGLGEQGLRGRHKVAHDLRARNEAIISGALPQTDAGIFFGGDDRATALALLTVGFSALRADLESTLRAHISDPTMDRARMWWTTEALPTFAEWDEFAKNEKASWIARFATSWEAFEEWRHRLLSMRDTARAVGLAVNAPPPAQLPMTLFQRGAAGRGSFLESLWTAVKSVAFGVVAIFGFFGLYGAYRDIRAKNFLRDPGPESTERYVSYYNRPGYAGPKPASARK